MTEKAKAKTKAKAKAAVWHEPKYDQYPVYKGDTYMGFVLYNENAQTLDCHCARHGCRVGRSAVPWDDSKGGSWTALRTAKGRPLGFLISWLFLESDKWPDGEAGRDGHFKASRDKDQNIMRGDSVERTSARKYVEEADHLEAMRSEERRPWHGEGIEPLGPF